MIKILKMGHFVDCDIESNELLVVVKAFNFFDLILLKVEFFKIDEGFKTTNFLDEIGLQSD